MEINKDNIAKMQLLKYDMFKEQNPEVGLFDVMFEVEGKILYAHKTMLNLISTTFASMLADRWTTKDQPIKIKDYSYDNFYQFLTFLYSGQCQLSDSNISAMIDIAEFYGIDIFKAYCDEYISAMDIRAENVFPMIELAEKYSMDQLKASLHGFILNNFTSFYDSEGFLNANKSFIEGLVVALKDKIKPEELFQAVFKWCEKRASDKQAVVDNFNLCDTIKTEISSFLAHIHFERMERKFFNEFVVSRGFIFSSYSELSKIVCNRDNYGETKVRVTNCNGQTLHGYLIRDKSVSEELQILKLSTCYIGHDTYCWWNTRCKIPSSPSPLEKTYGIDWYLIYYNAGQLCVQRASDIDEGNYLLAGLTAGASGFDTAKGCKIDIL